MSFKVLGVESVIRQLREMPIKMARGTLKRAVLAGAEPIREAMERGAPRGDPSAPTLSEIVVMSGSSPANELTAIAFVGPNKEAFYGLFQELGTRYHKAQTFARPALDTAHEEAVTEMEHQLWIDLSDLVVTDGSGGIGGLI
jgi:HK97 gp10 family phage protein